MCTPIFVNNPLTPPLLNVKQLWKSIVDKYCPEAAPCRALATKLSEAKILNSTETYNDCCGEFVRQLVKVLSQSDNDLIG